MKPGLSVKPKGYQSCVYYQGTKNALLNLYLMCFELCVLLLCVFLFKLYQGEGLSSIPFVLDLSNIVTLFAKYF